MKHLLIIFSIIFLVSCKKDKNIETSESRNHDYQVNTSYEFKTIDSDNKEIIAYRGDTLRISMNFDSNKEINLIAIGYLNRDGHKTLLNSRYVNDSYDAGFHYFNSKSASLEYYLPLYAPHNFHELAEVFRYTNQVRLTIEYQNDQGEIVHIDTLPSIKIKDLDLNENQKIYNIGCKVKGYTRGYSFHSNSLISHDFIKSNENSASFTPIDDESILLINKPNKDYSFTLDTTINKNFNKGLIVPTGNHKFIKVVDKVNSELFPTSQPETVTFDNTKTPHFLKRIYNHHKNKINEIIHPKQGDLYAFEYFDTSEPNKIHKAYGLIEITEIHDDELTEENGGHDKDYIEFRMKSFNNKNRFK